MFAHSGRMRIKVVQHEDTSISWLVEKGSCNKHENKQKKSGDK